MVWLRRSGRPLRVAMIGTRGVPARYGGFETAVEEIGQRMVRMGIDVTVYCRKSQGIRAKSYLGMNLVHLPALRLKVAETLSHTALSVLHLFFRRRPDAVFMFNAANAPFIPLCRLRGAPVAVHVDGLEWRRTKWGGRGRSYYRKAEELSVRWADALIADAQGIADYYQAEFDADTTLLTYGAPVLQDQRTDKLAATGLAPGRFHLVVARFEPENHVELIVEGYRRSRAALPLIVVGSAPYAHEYCQRIESLADGDPRIRLLGGVWDQDLLNQLYAHARTYIHGHSVGGTNPSLLRAIGAGTAVIAYDVAFNREVLGQDDGRYFTSAADLTGPIEALEADPVLARALGDRLQERALANYRWDKVTDGYAELAAALAAGYTTRGASGGRNAVSAWAGTKAASADSERAGVRAVSLPAVSPVRMHAAVSNTDERN